MKVGIVEIAPELAAEAFAVLRDAQALVLGSLDARPNLRIVVSHDLLPAECAPAPGRATPVVMMTIRTEDADGARRYRLVGFHLNPWAARDIAAGPAPAPKRRAR